MTVRLVIPVINWLHFHKPFFPFLLFLPMLRVQIWRGTNVFLPLCCLHCLTWCSAAAGSPGRRAPSMGLSLRLILTPMHLIRWAHYLSVCYMARWSRPRRGIIFLHCSGGIRITLTGTEQKRFDTLNAQRPVLWHLLSVVVVSSSSATTLPFFQVSLGLCYLQLCRWKVPSSFSVWHLGFLGRMGTAEGAVGQASPRLSHPGCSRPSPDPPADLNLPFWHITPQTRGVYVHLGARTERAREGCVAKTSPPTPAEHWCITESKSDAACFYITDLMGFVWLAYILMLQVSLAVSETCRPPSLFLLCTSFLKKK